MRRSLAAAAVAAVAGLIAAGLPAATHAAPGQVDESGAPPVTVMLQLDVEPAATVYQRASGAGPRAARAAGQLQTRAVEMVQSPVARAAAALGAREIFRVSATYAGIAVQAPPDRVRALRAIPGVASVRPLPHYDLGNWASVPLVQAPEVWQSAGLTGRGITLGIIDTGIDYTHADFGGPGTVAAYQAALAAKERGEAAVYPDMAKVAGGYDFAGNSYNSRDPANATPRPDDNPLDCQGHGTHVAGSAGGYGVDAEGTTYRGPWNADLPFAEFGIGPGVAPEVTLYALKAFGCKGSSNLVVAAIDWAMDPNQDGDLSDHLDVVNMSLGSPFGAQDDPTAVATQNAALAGMSVVVGAGNSGAGYLAVGSPSTAPAAISVAANITDGLVVDTMRLSIDGAVETVKGVMVSEFSAEEPREITAPVTHIGDWDAPASATNNTDACGPLSDADKERVRGTFLAVQSVVPRRCDPATGVRNSAAAGATGTIVATESAVPTSLPFSGRPLAMTVMADTSEALRAAFGAGTLVEATMGSFGLDAGRFVYRGAHSRAARVAAFSSMGGPLPGTVKPDITAPGASIFSASSGTGNGGHATVGTSMATPHVAGQAALVRQAHPTWTALEVKSAIVSSVDQDLYRDNDEKGPREDVMRVGTGRSDVVRSIAADTVVSVPGSPGSTSVSFGIVDARQAMMRSQRVRITDKRSTGPAREYAVRLDPVNSVPGATYTVSPTRLRLRPGQSGDVTVTLRVNPARLTHRPDPTLTLVPEGTTYMREFLAPATALLVLESPGAPSLRVSVAAAPRPASALSAAAEVQVSGTGDRLTGTLTLTGSGVDTRSPVRFERIRSRVSALQLLGESPRQDVCVQAVRCLPLASEAGGDLRYAGASSDAQLSANPLSRDDTALGYFGLSTWGAWKTPYAPGAFTVHLDTDRDGTADAQIRSAQIGSYQIMTANLYSLRPGDSPTRVIDSVPLNNVDGRRDTAKIHGNVAVLPVRLAALAQPAAFNPRVSAAPFISAEDATVHFWVTSSWPTPAGDIELDAVGSAADPMVIDLLEPALTAFGTGDRPMPALAMPGTQLQVSASREGQALRLLVLHHLNVLPRRAEVVAVASVAGEEPS